MGLVDDDNTLNKEAEEIGLEWQLGRAGRYPLTHKHQLKADGSVETLPLPPIVLAALRIAADPSRTPYRRVAEGLHMRRASPIAVHHEHRPADRAAEPRAASTRDAGSY